MDRIRSSTANLDSFATVIMLIQAKDRVKNDFPKGAVVTYYDIAHNVYGSYLGIAVYFFSVTGSLGFVLAKANLLYSLCQELSFE